MPGPTARRELVSPQTGMGVHAAVIGHCAITILFEVLCLFSSCCTHGTWYLKWLLCPHTVKPCLIEPLPCPWVMGHD